jgi:hypothetical protein
MREIAWRMGFTLVALVVLMTLAPHLSFGTTPYRLEEALGQTPQALVTDYLSAVAQGELEAALTLWQGPAGPERSAMTEELARYGASMQHRVVDVTWWRTCCEAVPIDDPDGASVATIRVTIRGEDQGAQIYVFETRAGEEARDGAAISSMRDWTIVGAHRESQVSEIQAWR